MSMATDTVPSIEAIRRQVRRLEAFVKTLTPADLERPTPCKGWLVRDLLAHNASGAEGVNGFLEAVLAGRPTEGFTLADQGAINQAGVDKYRDAPNLTEIFEREMNRALGLLDQTVERGLTKTRFNFFAPITVEQLAGLLAADVATHEWDYGKAVARPRVPDPGILAGALPVLIEDVLPLTFLPEKAGTLACTYGIKLTDIPNGEWVIAIDNGRVAVRREPIARARVKTTTDAGTFLLITYGRINPLVQILRGRVKTGGNPLLGMKFGSLFQKV